MARIVAVAGCALLALTAAAQLALGRPFVWWPVGLEAAVVGIALAFERGRYRPRLTSVSSAFTPTGERFADPTSGQVLEVYSDPQTGERDYRPSA
jgi:hypothetical protein